MHQDHHQSRDADQSHTDEVQTNGQPPHGAAEEEEGGLVRVQSAAVDRKEVPLPPVGLQRGQALQADGDVGQQRRHGSVFQTFELPNEYSGDAMKGPEQQNKGPHCRKEPWENTADDPQATEDQQDVLKEHLSLEWQTSVHWGAIERHTFDRTKLKVFYHNR